MIWNILTHPLVAFQTLTTAHSLGNRTFQVWSETFNCCHIFLFVTANWDPSGVLWISYSKIKKKIDVFMGRFTQEHDMECSKQSTGCIWIVLKVMTHNDPSDVLKIGNLRLMPWFFFLFPFFRTIRSKRYKAAKISRWNDIFKPRHSHFYIIERTLASVFTSFAESQLVIRILILHQIPPWREGINYLESRKW